MIDKKAEVNLLDYARKATLHAELAAGCETQLAKVSADTARNARKDVLEAIEWLQGLEKALSYRMNEE